MSKDSKLSELKAKFETAADSQTPPGPPPSRNRAATLCADSSTSVSHPAAAVPLKLPSVAGSSDEVVPPKPSQLKAGAGAALANGAFTKITGPSAPGFAPNRVPASTNASAGAALPGAKVVNQVSILFTSLIRPLNFPCVHSCMPFSHHLPHCRRHQPP